MIAVLMGIERARLGLSQKAARGVKVMLPNLTEKCGNKTSRKTKLNNKTANAKSQPESWKTKGCISCGHLVCWDFILDMWVWVV